jgi:spore coat protein H
MGSQEPPPTRCSTSSPRARALALGAVLALVAACTTGGTESDTTVATGQETASTDERFTPHPLRLELEDDVVRELYTRDPFSDDRVDGRMFDGATDEELELDGLRFRGSSSRLHPKKSFNIRLAEGQDFLFGSDRMNLKAMYTDPTIMRETLAMDMWHELGNPAPRTRYVDLWINDHYEGLYLHVERVDEDLLANAGLNPDGTLVRDEFRDNPGIPESAFASDFDALAEPDLPSLLAENFNDRNDPNWEALADLVTWAAIQQPGPTFADELAQRFDLDILLDWIALHSLVGDVDAFGDDYWLYLDHEDPGARWIVIPWDKDLAFGSHDRDGIDNLNDYFGYELDIRGAAERFRNDLVMNILDTPELRQQLDERTLGLLDEFPLTWFEEKVAAIGDGMRSSLETGPGPGRFALHPDNHQGELGRFDQHVEAILDYVELRWAQLRQVTGRAPLPVGDRAEAGVPLAALTGGQRVLLTDAQGWTIAALTVDDGAGGTDDLRFEVVVERSEESPAVDRRWRLINPGPGLSAELTLYYRNDVGASQSGLPAVNWYMEDEPVGRQGDLIVLRVDDGASALVPTRVNPMSNKATVTMVIPNGLTDLVLTFPELVPEPA